MTEQFLQSDLVWTVVTALVYASLGGAYAYSGYSKDEEADWDWGKAKYPIGFTTALGVVSGLLMMSLGYPIISTAFGAAMLMTAILADQLRQMIEGGHDHYRNLLKQGVPPEEAAMRAVIEGASHADLEMVISAVEEFTRTHGTPSREGVEQSRDALRDAYEEGGPEGMAEEAGGFYGDPEAILEGIGEDIEDIDEERRESIGLPPREQSDDEVVTDGP